jgi:hypothetical protein
LKRALAKPVGAPEFAVPNSSVVFVQRGGLRGKGPGQLHITYRGDRVLLRLEVA